VLLGRPRVPPGGRRAGEVECAAGRLLRRGGRGLVMQGWRELVRLCGLRRRGHGPATQRRPPAGAAQSRTDAANNPAHRVICYCPSRYSKQSGRKKWMEDLMHSDH
jgi:hypothetical protein